ncbi:bifunctional serine/threonine-protein kinase/formylglycine-generating enzyme family protein [Stieleria sp. TO1_6]|uniref:bifunctional serine/threonine-protein kinase/formylglycine-generating enzyme family protein n=1 Tax=Stieleria tagensis TaxID=2956795 RepID=UPI00209AEE93|nr:bifunctional serine/threonine-protein kinase/formylglycine-generating enzyme family protein [Stieleria tagensis]MCO8122379.1 bifunctional serine/threonine-protein kinase/formylglycine-generating enzyme family protein [Stieleria tagensis]
MATLPTNTPVPPIKFVSAMYVRCPKCDTSIEASESENLSELLCTGCGEKINLFVEEESTTDPPDSFPEIGQFRLIAQVGKGGFGVVWKAEDTQLDRFVAIKTPRPGSIAPDKSNQFIREAQAAAQLHHPNIVSVHEVGRTADGIYIVSDFIDGTTLYKWMHENEPEIRQAAKLCITIADALQHAHAAGIIHRDIKPGNILIDTDQIPYVTDFGLAQRQFGDTAMTVDQRIVGTPSYMSPEQALGERVDCRTDIYSLGVLLFELLTGTRPFRGSRNRVLQKVIEEDPIYPRRLNGSVPRDLETICLKCLQKHPSSRYQSADELRDDLQRFLDHQPIHARPTNSLERIGKWCVRKPLVASLYALVFLATVAGISGVTWQWQRALASQRRHAKTQIRLIREAEPAAVLPAIDGLDEFRQWTDPELKMLAKSDDLPPSDRFRVRLALVGENPDYAAPITHQLLFDPSLDFPELSLGIKLLSRSGALPTPALSESARNPTLDDSQRFRSIFMLALIEGLMPQSSQTDWQELAPFTAENLVYQTSRFPDHYQILVAAFRSVQANLSPALRDYLFKDQPGDNERYTATSILGEYLIDDPQQLCDVLMRLSGDPFKVLLQSVNQHTDHAIAHFESVLATTAPVPGIDDNSTEWLSRKATAAVARLYLGQDPRGVWALFSHSPDPTLRTFLVHRCAELQLPPEIIIDQLDKESDASARRALILALGQYRGVSDELKNVVRPELAQWYRSDADAGIHSAVAWLLHRWDENELVDRMDNEPAFHEIVPTRQWFVNSVGNTMIIVDHPPVFRMGAPANEPMRTKSDRQHLRKIDRKIAVATTEVTWEQFQQFSDAVDQIEYEHPIDYGPDPKGPALSVDWVQSAMYCRWLSEQEGIAEDQMCFPPLDEINVNMQLPDDLLQRTGYRLPTEGEWECVCRAGTTTIRFFGCCEKSINEYGWHIANSNDFAYRVGLLKPNDYGLFDVYGNAWEWCIDRHGSLPTRGPGQHYVDAPKLVGTKGHVLRGGSMNTRAAALRSAQRDFLDTEHNRNHNVGFRIVRTLSD